MGKADEENLFPKLCFMRAQKGSHASWWWSSLLEGRKLLSNGLRWRIGDGLCVKIWSDRWILGIEGGKLNSESLNSECGKVWVKDTIEKGTSKLEGLDQCISGKEMRLIRLACSSSYYREG